MILGQTCTSDSPRIDKFKSYKLTSCIELFHSLTGPQNLKCYCASLIHLCFFPALFYYLPCCVLISTTPYKYDCPADRGPNLPCRDQTPSCFPLHTLLEKDYSFLLLRTCAMPSSPSHLSPRPEYFRQFWFFHLQLMLEQHPIGLPLRPNPMCFWSLYVVRGDCSATLQLIWLGETPFLAIHLCISFQGTKVSPLELFTFSLVSTFSCCFLTGTIFASAVWFHCQLSFWSSFYFSGFFDLDCRCVDQLTSLSWFLHLYCTQHLCLFLHRPICLCRARMTGTWMLPFAMLHLSLSLILTFLSPPFASPLSDFIPLSPPFLSPWLVPRNYGVFSSFPTIYLFFFLCLLQHLLLRHLLTLALHFAAFSCLL